MSVSKSELCLEIAGAILRELVDELTDMETKLVQEDQRMVDSVVSSR